MQERTCPSHTQAILLPLWYSCVRVPVAESDNGFESHRSFQLLRSSSCHLYGRRLYERSAITSHLAIANDDNIKYPTFIHREWSHR